nr:unnamed protein product [Digitaria exilis]
MPALRSPSARSDLSTGDGDGGDPDYMYFLQHLRVEGDSYVLELPGNGASPPAVLRYEAPPGGSSGGEYISDPSADRLSSTNRRTKERDSSGPASSLDARPAWQDPLDGVDEDYRLFLQHTRLVDGQLVLEFGGVVVNYDNEPVAAGSLGENDEEQGMEIAVASPGKGISVEMVRDKVQPGALVTFVPEQYACDWPADPSPGREVEEKDGGDEELSVASPDAADAGTMEGVYWEASSSDGHRDGGHTVSKR